MWCCGPAWCGPAWCGPARCDSSSATRGQAWRGRWHLTAVRGAHQSPFVWAGASLPVEVGRRGDGRCGSRSSGRWAVIDLRTWSTERRSEQESGAEQAPLPMGRFNRRADDRQDWRTRCTPAPASGTRHARGWRLGAPDGERPELRRRPSPHAGGTAGPAFPASSPGSSPRRLSAHCAPPGVTVARRAVSRTVRRRSIRGVDGPNVRSRCGSARGGRARDEGRGERNEV